MVDLSADSETRATREELNTSRPSTLDKITMLRVLKSQFRDDASHSAKWRAEAKEDYDFKAGRQWSPDEKSQLNEQLRPEIVFNRSLTIIKAVAGFEINGRHEIQFLPRNTQDTQVNEVLTGASKWMADECDAEDEESEAFQDCVTCGMGWTFARVEYEKDSAGLYEETEINPLEMYWDHRSRKRNLSDKKRVAWVRKMPLGEAREMFPGRVRDDGVVEKFGDDELDARWAEGIEPEEQTKTIEQKRKREENAGDNYIEDDDVTIVQMQWSERVPYWLVADEATNKKVDMPDAKFQLLKRRMAALGMKLTAVKIYKREYFQAFLGGVVLEVGPAPMPDKFSFECITGEQDKNKGVWFGLIRMMRDPQKWANKWLSQTLHIMNSMSKGGIMAEPSAFDDQRQAEETWARPEAITWMAKGALSGQSGAKWALKPQSTFPAGFFNLLEFAVTSLRDVTGINLELLGQKDVNQPGILEAQRKQAGMTVLATMFDSLRRFRKNIGRIRLFFVQNFLSDGRLIRITGQEGAQVIPLIRDKCLGMYDVVVDDAPTSPNQKQANWAVVAPLIPMFKEQLTANPELLLELLTFSPLPNRLVEAIRMAVQKVGPAQQMQQKLQQLNLAKIVAAINKDQSTAEMQNAKAGATQATAMYDLAMARNLLTKSGFGALADHLDHAHKAAQIESENAQAEQTRANAERTRAETLRTHAQTLGEHADTLGTQADTAETHARTMGTHPDTLHTHAKAAQAGISALIDALSPIPQPEPAQ